MYFVNISLFVLKYSSIFILKKLELPTIRVDPNTTVKKASDLKPDSGKSLEYLSTFFKKI